MINSVQFSWKEEWGGSEVFVIGDFTAWGELLPMEYDADRKEFVLAASLPVCVEFGSSDNSEVDMGMGYTCMYMYVYSWICYCCEAHMCCRHLHTCIHIAPSHTYLTAHIHTSHHTQPGTYSYQFLVDGQWQVSPEEQVAPDDDGHICNKVRVFFCVCVCLCW